MKPPLALEPPFHLSAVAETAAVFLIHAEQGAPYLARTGMLRRRLARLLESPDRMVRRLALGGLARRVDYWPIASRLEANLLLYHLARQYFPRDYARRIRLRPAAFLKVLMTNRFPRTQVAAKVSGGESVYYGPFRNRASAERFEQEVLDLFQIRRCQEDLEPSVEHPGCIYGEMMKCLRPCQLVVGVSEYASEAGRLVDFLHTQGRSLLEPVAAARNRLSEELDFEAAQRQHQRYLRIEQALNARDELASELTKLNGVAVCRSMEAGRVDLVFLLGGLWLEPIEFNIAASGEVTPMDGRLRDIVSALVPPKKRIGEWNDHLALLARWFYSSARTEEWIAFESLDALPYRRLVRAISKTARGEQMDLFAG